jgi:hypothetical protein
MLFCFSFVDDKYVSATNTMFRCVSPHHIMARSLVEEGGYDRWVWTVAEDISIKYSRTVDKG